MEQQNKQATRIAKQFFKHSVGLSFGEASLRLITIVRNKFLAITVGASGIGTFSALNSFFGFIGTFVWGALLVSGTQFVSRALSEDKKGEVHYISTLLVTVGLFFSIPVSGLLILFRSRVVGLGLKSAVPIVLFIFYCVAFSFQFLRTIGLALIQGLQRFKQVIKVRLVIYSLELMCVVILTLLFDVKGFIGAMSLATVIAGVIYTYVLRDTFEFRLLHDVDILKSVFKPLLSFIGANFFLGVINSSVSFLQRYIILDRLSLESVGLFEVGMGIFYLMAVANSGSAFYFLPKMSEKQTSEERSYAIHTYFFYAVIFGIGLCIPTVLFGKLLIRILYSQEFLPLSNIIYLFVLAQFIGTFVSPQGITLVGLRRMGIHIICSVISLGLMIIIPFLFFDTIGLSTIPLGLIVGYFISGVIRLWYLRIRNLATFDLNPFVAMLGVVICIIAAHFLRDKSLLLRGAFLAMIWGSVLTFVLSKPNIRRTMWDYGKQFPNVIKQLKGIRT